MLPDWLDTEYARADREDGLDRLCEVCGLPFWACQAAAMEAHRRGGKFTRADLDAEARRYLGGEDG